MDKFQKFIEKHIIPITGRIGAQRHLQAIRDGIIFVLPLILIGSFFLLLAQPPGKYLEGLVKPYLPVIFIPYRLTFGLIALYVSGTVAYSLARSYKMEGISSAVLSMVGFFVAATPRDTVLHEGRQILSLYKDKMGWELPMTYYGSQGLFLAIIVALLVVEALRFLRSKKLMFTMPEGVPEGVSRAFEAIIPSFLVITLFWVLRDILQLNLPDLIIAVFSPIEKLGDSLFAIIMITVLASIIWFAGIHPVAVISPFARPIWLNLLTANAEALTAGGPGTILPHIAVDQFYYWFVWVGGSGATLALVLQLLFAKSKFLRQLGGMCLLPGMFNINEPLIFGLPIVANPLMIIPFTLAPIAGGVVAYGAFAMNLVQRPYISAPWTLPAPLGAFVSTGGDWKALVLSVIAIVLSGIVYYPFIRIYDRQMHQREIGEEQEQKQKQEEKDDPENESTNP